VIRLERKESSRKIFTIKFWFALYQNL